MNKNITDREDLFWAKMAGKDVDISTMTPPVAASVREELMLEVAERIGTGGSLPDMSGQSGKFLTNNGTAASWGDVSALPSMTEQSGKFLTNNGTAASWGDVPSDEYLITANFSELMVLSNFQHDGEAADSEEVLAAFNAGKLVRISASGTGNVAGNYASLDMTQNASGTMVFGGVGIIGENAVPVWKILSVIILSFASPASMTVIDTLPDIRNGDTGKVLGVDSNNKYALLNNTGNDMLIVLTATSQNNEWAASYNGSPISVAQIIAARTAGKNVRCQLVNSGTVIGGTVNGSTDDDMVWFGFVFPDSTGGSVSVVPGVMVGAYDSEHDVDAWAVYPFA